ncbi:restriction system modified-DNA reader domain-containing protein [Micromonospora narathiwatensis]|uniref:RAMA domain-containing protein n=1 Tax=Micromonospora narathiwatensis TaxID=299146 RepID=A0A1A9A656_9ACTN|nr:hypothetical protein [Micromonospora narathiwatensis]SBT51674.1 protein of unknown function (DUF4357) [Micromonospora narathiwatensis]
MPTIRIDDEVYELLQRKAQPFVDTPNSVLRRELGLTDEPVQARPERRTNAPGELAPLLKAGLLKVGEELVWKRRQSMHRAVVTADGWLELEDGRPFETPSGAARALSGYEVNGWRNWGRARDGVRLSSLRDQL